MAAGIAAQKRKVPPARITTVLKHRAGIEACQSVAVQAVPMGQNLPILTPTSTQTTNATNQQRRQQDHLAGCRMAHRTYADAVRQRNPDGTISIGIGICTFLPLMDT